MAATELRTARLRLRPPVAGDAEWIFASYAQDPEVTRYLSWAPHGSIDETRAFQEQLLEWLAEGDWAGWIIEPLEGERPVGMITASGVTGFKPELGFVLARSFWGQGIMTEAVRAVVEALLELEHVHRVGAMCDVDNPGSARALEKAGLEREGLLRRYGIHPNVSKTVPRDVHVYSVVKDVSSG